MSSQRDTLAASMSIERRRAALRSSLNMLATDWMGDHLIGNSPATDVMIISSPLQQLYSSEFETNYQLDTHHPTKTDCSASANSDNVIIPGFSKDGVSSGYLLSETFGVGSRHVITERNGRRCVRFLVEEETGTYVSLSCQSRADVLLYCTHQMRKSTFYFFAFPKHSLASLISDGVKDIEVFEAVIQHTFCGENLKQCNSCGKLLDEPCACVFEFMRVKSPLDLSAIKHNIVLTHLSRALGKGLYEVFENGVSKQVIPIHGQHQIFSVPQSGTSRRLLTWAIGSALGSVPVQIPPAISSFTCDFLSIDNSLDPVAVISDQLIPLTPPETQIPAPNPVSKTAHLYNHDLQKFSTVPTSSTDESSFSVLPPSAIADSGWSWSTSFQPNALIVSEQTSNGCPNDTDDGVHSFLSSVPTVAPTEPANLVPVDTTSTTPRFAKHRAKYRPVRIAPRISKNSSTPNDTSFDDDKMKKSVEEIRAWRLYNRRIRNRESAARSNRARKQREIASRKVLAESSR